MAGAVIKQPNDRMMEVIKLTRWVWVILFGKDKGRLPRKLGRGIA
jgi:hypothetical protein